MAEIGAFQAGTTREIAGGGQIEYRHGGVSLLVKTGEPTREHIDGWYEAVAQVYENWKSNTPVRVLFDVTAAGTTPYARQRIMELQALAQTHSMTSRTAFLVTEDNRGQLQVFVNITGTGGKHRLKIFTELESALNWLEDGL